jgi:ABC-type lipoprotein release transport system permease subunit
MILVAINALAFFGYYLHRFLPNPLYTNERAAALQAAEFILLVCIAMNFLSLIVIFWLITRGRYHEMGLLRGIGARRIFIFSLLFVETQMTVFCGMVLAALLGLGLAKMGFEALQPFFGDMAADGAFVKALLAFLAAFASAEIIAMLALLYPALKICRIEPHSALHNRE